MSLFNVVMITLAGVILLVCWVINKSYLVVSTGNAVVIERLGKYDRILTAGAHLLTPGIENIKPVIWTRTEEERTGSNSVKTVKKFYKLTTIPTNEQAHDLPEYFAITSDRISVSVNGILFYKIVNVEKAVYGINDLYKAIENLVETAIRDFTTKTTFEQIFSVRDSLTTSVITQLQDCEQSWGIKITRFDVQKIDCASKEIMRATENAVKHKREAEANLQLTQAQKKSEIVQLQATNELRLAAKQAELKQRKLERETEHELAILQLKAQLEEDKLHHEQQLQKAAAEAKQREIKVDSVLAEKRKEQQLKKEEWHNLVSSTADSALIQAKITCDAWQQISANDNFSFIGCPVESIKQLGNVALFNNLLMHSK